MELDSLYQEVILDHYKKPHHKGLPSGPIKVHHVNPNCGDEITLSLEIRDGLVEDLNLGRGWLFYLPSERLDYERSCKW